MINDLVREGTAFRAYVVLALPKLSWQLLLAGLRLKSVQSVARLRQAGAVDGLDTYLHMAVIAEMIADGYGGGLRRRLADLLRGAREERV